MEYLLQVADSSFAARCWKRRISRFSCCRDRSREFGKPEFKLFESWLDRVSTWADHDALVHYLIGPMIAADAAFLSRTVSLGKEGTPSRGISAPPP